MTEGKVKNDDALLENSEKTIKKDLRASNANQSGRNVTFPASPVDFLRCLIKVPLERVSEYLELRDLVTLAIHEPEVAERMKEIHFKGVTLSVEIGSGRSCILIEMGDRRTEVFLVKHNGNKGGPSLVELGENRKFVRSNEFFQTSNRIQNVYFSEFPALDVEFFVDCLKSFFRLEDHKLILSADYMLNLPHFASSLWKCNELELVSAHNVNLLPNKYFHYFINKASPKSLYIRTEGYRGYKPTEEINVDVYDDSGIGLLVEHLDLINTRVLALSQAKFSFLVYNTIIKNWISGSYEKLEHLVFWWWSIWGEVAPNPDMETVDNGIEKFPLEQNQLKTIGEDNIATSFGIKRADGRRAVVSIRGKQNGHPFWLRIIVFKNETDVPDCSISLKQPHKREWPERRGNYEVPDYWAM